MAQRKNEWLAPMLFKGSCHTETVNQWIEKMLLPELSQPSVIVIDNARFHNTEQIQKIISKSGHIILPLPRYSPDFNPIEYSFATIKNRRQFALNGTTIENILYHY
jgi:transposase